MNKFQQEAKTSKLGTQEQIKEKLDDLANKSLAYYYNDHLLILEYLNKALADIIKDNTTRSLMPKVYVNEVPRIVNRLAMLYKEQPERIYNKEPNTQQLKELTKLKKYYKEIHRQAKLLNTVLCRPVAQKSGNYEIQIYGRNLINIKEDEDDYNAMKEVSYYREIGGELFMIRWTDEEMIKFDAVGNIIERIDNPYKQIPFVKLKLKETNDFWGDGLIDIVNLAEQNNIKLIDSFYKSWMAFGYPIGTNLNVTANEFDIAPYRPIMINNAREGLMPPSLQFVTPDHRIEQDQSLIDWLRKTSANTKGFSSSAFQDISEMSGYRKLLDESEIIEANEEDKESLIVFEKQLFELLVKESEINGKIKFTGLALEDVVFKPYKTIKTTDEIWAEREYQYKYNIASPIDWLKELYPNITDEDAKAILAKNRQLKIEVGGEVPNIVELSKL